ncbi:MAG: hypothetical protein IPO69_05500 [Saprospiraceae bacterium]|nr:hypothetical protein [Saprospiraceae bacterium]MBK9678312.1 hypothetical protein [Saprospiraceae bacterium]
MKIIPAFLFLIIFSCGDKGTDLSDEFVTVEAKLVNQLPVDGCGWHFTLPLGDEWGQYVADDHSEAKVDNIISQVASNNGIFEIKVNITFRLTGKTKEVQCGWGKKAAMDEIEVKELKAL